MNRSGVLLLDGGGFIGTALANRFAGEGRQVYVLGSNAPSTTTDAHFQPGRPGDSKLLANLLPKCGTVIHLTSATTLGNSANHAALELGNLVLSLRASKAYGPVQVLRRGFGLIRTLLEHARCGNPGSGREYSINQVRQIVEQVIGVELKTTCRPPRGIDVRAIVPDISRLDACLSWNPQTSLEEGVRRTLDWLKQA